MGTDGRPRAFVTAPLRGEGLERLRKALEVVYEPWVEQQPLRLYTSEQLRARVADESAEFLVVEADQVGPEVFGEKLRAVAATRADPVNVDLGAAAQAGVPVLHCPGRNADAVAELAVGLMIAVSRHVVTADGELRSGNTYRDGTVPNIRFRGWELAGRTAGIVGLGSVGRALQWRLDALGMEVIAHDPYAEEATVGLDELLARSDVVSMHAAVTDSTRGMMGAEQFAAMRQGSFYVNTARAQLHDTDALVRALESGHLAGAALDHFVGEDLPEGHPLKAMPNVVLTPHIGGATWDTECRQATMVADDVERILAGREPLHAVGAGARA